MCLQVKLFCTASYELDKPYKLSYYYSMVNNNSVSIDELRSNLADIVNRVTYANDKVIVNKYNRDVAIIMSLDEYEKLLDPTKRLSEREWTDHVKKLDEFRAKIPHFNPEEMEKAIEETVQEVRAENKKSASE